MTMAGEKGSEENLFFAKMLTAKFRLTALGSNLGLHGVYVTSRVLRHKE